MDTESDIETATTTTDRSGSTAADWLERRRHPQPEEVVVRRNGLLSLLLAAVSALVAAAFLSRGVADPAFVWWVVGIALFAMTWGYVFTLLDSRTPLMVADEQGIRLRLGRTWRGIAWTELDEVEHQPRRWLRDGRLVLFPLDLDAELELLGPAGRRHAGANRWLYHAAFTMPLALTTRVHGTDGDLTGALAALSAGRCPIVQIQSSSQVESDESDDSAAVTEVDAGTESELDATDVVDEQVFDQFAPGPDAELSDEIATETDEAESTDEADQADQAASDAAAALAIVPVPVVASPTPWPARAPRLAIRADVARLREVSDQADVDTDPDATQFFDREQVAAMDADETDTGVWRASTEVIGDLADQPVVEPVIGPVLATARRLLHLDIDQVSERTRIRPHVIEAIEIDDFAVCGGDFYARGHLRTLARVLGIDVAPLLAIYDKRYADAPIDPKRVFEADLAGAGRGPIRSTRGGPNWSVLVAAVMTLVLAWSVARLVTDHPVTHPGSAGLANGSAGLSSSETKASPVPVTLTAAGGGAHLVVRDGTGKVVFTGDLAFGQSRVVQVAPPVRVQSTDGSTRVAVQGKDEGKLGKTGQPAEHVFTAR